MPRKSIIRSSNFPYHVTNRSTDKQFYPFELNELWNKSCDLLRILSYCYGLKTHAFVLMSNHYHLLASTPEENIDVCIGYFQSEFSKWINKRTQLQRFKFSGPYRWTIISNVSYFLKTYRYVYQNPVRAGLCENAEEYPFSSLSGRCGLSANFPPLHIQELFQGALPEDIFDELSFINELRPDFEIQETRKFLRRA